MKEEKCFECESQARERHHVIPRSLGGKRTVPLCIECHSLIHGFDARRRDNHRELVKKALDAKRVREGKKIINGAPFHKTKVDMKKVQRRSVEVRQQNIINQQGHLILLAKKLRREGNTFQGIANLLNNEGHKTIRGYKFMPFQVFSMIKRDLSGTIYDGPSEVEQIVT